MIIANDTMVSDMNITTTLIIDDIDKKGFYDHIRHSISKFPGSKYKIEANVLIVTLEEEEIKFAIEPALSTYLYVKCGPLEFNSIVDNYFAAFQEIYPFVHLKDNIITGDNIEDYKQGFRDIIINRIEHINDFLYKLSAADRKWYHKGQIYHTINSNNDKPHYGIMSDDQVIDHFIRNCAQRLQLSTDFCDELYKGYPIEFNINLTADEFRMKGSYNVFRWLEMKPNFFLH